MATLGGIIGPIIEEDAVTTAENVFVYPCLIMAGTSMDPTAAVSATATPVTPAKNMLAKILTYARPPLKCPTRLLAKSTRRGKTPLRLIRSPAMMKKGMAIRGKESMPPNINVGRTFKGMDSVTKINATPARPRQKATGTPSKIVTTKTTHSVSMPNPAFRYLLRVFR